MSFEKKISVVIPYFNHEKFIFDALESIEKQKYLPHEIIIVDDHSDTPLSSILKNRLESSVIQIKIIRHEKNQGVSAARNTGIKKASGEYLAFLDADDCWSPYHLEDFLVALKTWEETDFYSAAPKIFKKKCPEISEKHSVIEKTDYLNLVAKNSLYVNSSSVIFSKKLVEHTGFFNEKLKVFEDIDYWIRAGKRAGVIFNHKQNVYIRKTGEGLSRNLDFYLHEETVSFFHKYLHDETTRPFMIQNVFGTAMRFKKEGKPIPRVLLNFIQNNKLTSYQKLLLKIPSFVFKLII